MGITVEVDGALFNGQAAAARAAFLDEAKFRVGGQMLADVQQILNRDIRHPTPYYETQVTLQQVREDYVVHDRGIVYGPWLEGVSYRNQTTRFKGYHAFRRATQELAGKVQGIVVSVLRGGYLTRMGG